MDACGPCGQSQLISKTGCILYISLIFLYSTIKKCPLYYADIYVGVELAQNETIPSAMVLCSSAGVHLRSCLSIASPIATNNAVQQFHCLIA